MGRARRLLATLAALVMVTGAALGVATPAYAACGDTSGSWVPVGGSVWNAEFFIDSYDYTGQVVLTYTGAIAAMTIDDTLQVFTGNWDYEGDSVFAWSATDVADNGNRLTLRVAADDCGLLGGVHDAYGVIIHQTMGQIGTVFVGRVT